MHVMGVGCCRIWATITHKYFLGMLFVLFAGLLTMVDVHDRPVGLSTDRSFRCVPSVAARALITTEPLGTVGMMLRNISSIHMFKK
jgi:hypothetical protein